MLLITFDWRGIVEVLLTQNWVDRFFQWDIVYVVLFICHDQLSELMSWLDQPKWFWWVDKTLLDVWYLFLPRVQISILKRLISTSYLTPPGLDVVVSTCEIFTLNVASLPRFKRVNSMQCLTPLGLDVISILTTRRFLFWSTVLLNEIATICSYC